MLVRLEMDQKRMTYLLFDISPHMVPPFTIMAFLATGFVLGLFYFIDLWWSIRLFTAGGHTQAAIALTVARFILLGGFLMLVSLQGAIPLLLAALGFLAGRIAVIRRLRESAS